MQNDEALLTFHQRLRNDARTLFQVFVRDAVETEILSGQVVRLEDPSGHRSHSQGLGTRDEADLRVRDVGSASRKTKLEFPGFAGLGELGSEV